MVVTFFWGQYDEIAYDYRLSNSEVLKLKEEARKDLLDTLEGKTIEEKALHLINEYDFDSSEEPESIINEMVDIMLDDGDYDDLARELFDDSASDEYNEYHSYKDEYDYYGVSRSDFFRY